VSGGRGAWAGEDLTMWVVSARSNGSRYDDISTAVNELCLHVTPDHVMVLQSAGPVGGGLPELGMLPLPKTLLWQGVRDASHFGCLRERHELWRLRRARRAESADSGALAALCNGDLISKDAEARAIHLHVDDAEIAIRLRSWSPLRDYPLG
jgi:dihydroxyacid dehydratase/phosphogluconate dehydratase